MASTLCAVPVPARMLPLAAVVLALSACGGSSSNSSSTTPAGGPGGGFAAARDPKVAACLKKQGVTLPQRPRNRPSQPPAGTATVPAPGSRPRGGFGDPKRFAKLRAALAKCGVTLPSGTPGGPPGAPATAPGDAQN